MSQLVVHPLLTKILDPPLDLHFGPAALELQILLEEQTATEILFLSYAVTTTIDRMT